MDALRKLPLFGELFNARRTSLRSSLYELGIGTLFSTLPLWFFPVIFAITIQGVPSTSELIITSLSKGELYIYSASLVGPLIYAITKNYIEFKEPEKGGSKLLGRMTFQFPYGLFFVLISILICMLAAFFYSFTNLPLFKNESMKLNISSVFYISVFTYLFSLLCFYAVTVYRYELENVSKNLPLDERSFLDQWKNR